jgi:uncharacterized membrane protein
LDETLIWAGIRKIENSLESLASVLELSVYIELNLNLVFLSELVTCLGVSVVAILLLKILLRCPS